MTDLPLFRTHAPCGQCQAYVPLEVGCRHWRVMNKALTSAERARKRWENMSEEQRDVVRERNRVASQRYRDKADAARVKAQEAVAEFRRAMGHTG